MYHERIRLTEAVGGGGGGILQVQCEGLPHYVYQQADWQLGVR